MSHAKTTAGQQSGSGVVDTVVESVTGTTFLTMMAMFGARVAVVAGVSNPVGALAAGAALIGAGVMASRAFAREKATIFWDDPEPVDYEDGGFRLSAAQLNAIVDPRGATLAYDPPQGTKLDGDRPAPGGRTKTARNLGTSYSMVATIRVGAIRLRVIAAPTGAKGSAKCPPPRFWTVSFVSHAKGVVSQPRCSDGVR